MSKTGKTIIWILVLVVFGVLGLKIYNRLSLFHRLFSNDYDIRIHAGLELDELSLESKRKYLKPFLQILKDKKQNLYNRKDAQQYISSQLREVSFSTLIDNCKDQDPLVRALSVQSLGWTGRKRAAESSSVLMQALKDEDSMVRRNAIYSLGEIGAPTDRAVTELINALKNKDAKTRSAAAYALGQLHAKQAIKPLIRAINDQERTVRSSALYAIIRIDPQIEEIVPLLISKLKDSDGGTRSLAAEFLGKTGSKSKTIVQALIRALGDTDPRVQRDALDTLKKIGTPAALRAADEFLARRKS